MKSDNSSTSKSALTGEILLVEQMKIGASSSQTEGSWTNPISADASLGFISDVDFESSIDESMVIDISVTGELSKFVDLKLKMMRPSSSRETEDYFFIVKKKLTNENDHSTGVLVPEHLLYKGENGSTELPTTDEWSQACVISLTDRDSESLPEKPDCPNLVVLFLQRNKGLYEFPPSFFDRMPALRFVNLSDTRIRNVPTSLCSLPKLQVLLLRNCFYLDDLPTEIGNLQHIEVLDVMDTELLELPDQLGQLTRLRNLKLLLYGPDDEEDYHLFPSKLLSRNIISKLQKLETLIIGVHPKDPRWKNIADDITKEIAGLKMLSHLQFYFTKTENLQYFVQTSSTWSEDRLKTFKFIVGRNFKRIIDSVPEEVETEFDKQERTLRFARGTDFPKVIENVLERATAFFLDNHEQVYSLSQFGISNFRDVKYCVVRECPKLEVLIDEEERSEISIIMPNLEYLGIFYAWELQHIWKPHVPLPHGSFHALKHLFIQICFEIQFILSIPMVRCLSNLEVLIVENCDELITIIEQGKETLKNDNTVLPRLRKIQLRHLPKLVSLGSGLRLAEEKVFFYDCPNFKLNGKGNGKGKKPLVSLCGCIK